MSANVKTFLLFTAAADAIKMSPKMRHTIRITHFIFKGYENLNPAFLNKKAKYIVALFNEHLRLKYMYKSHLN